MLQMGDHTSIKPSRKKTLNVLIANFETSKVLDWEGLKFPVNLIDITNFENHNSSISVGYEKLVYPLIISEHNYKRESTVNPLLISDDTKQDCCWIKDISTLLSLQTSKYCHAR